MPELPEIEAYRLLAERVVGRRISAVDAPDAWFLKRGLDAPTAHESLLGMAITGARRIGKLLLLDTVNGPTLGLRFGMTGRLIVDGIAGVEGMLYSSDRSDLSWDRFRLEFQGGGELRVRDPRRLGGVELDPDETALGQDARGISAASLRRALAGSRTALKPRLMDQSRIAGVGNLIADETLFRAGLDPTRAAGSLAESELRRLHRHLTATIEELIRRGGSHTGDFLPHRVAGGTCPRDGAPLRREAVGGRTTYWCPAHQG